MASKAADFESKFSEKQIQLIARSLRWYRDTFRVDNRPRSWVKIARDILEWDEAPKFFPNVHDMVDAPEFDGAKSKEDKGWPLTGQVLERWIVGMAGKNGQRRHTRPSHQKLLAISGYLIDQNFLIEEQLYAHNRLKAERDVIANRMASKEYSIASFLAFSPIITLGQFFGDYVVERQNFVNNADGTVMDTDLEELWFDETQFSNESDCYSKWQNKKPRKRIQYSGFSISAGPFTALQFFWPVQEDYGKPMSNILIEDVSQEHEKVKRTTVSFRSIKLTQIKNVFKFNEIKDDPARKSMPLVYEEPIARRTRRNRAKTRFIGPGNEETMEVMNYWENIFLFGAAKHGHVDDAETQLQRGADPNFVDPDSGSCAIHFAAAISCHALVDLLQSHEDFDPLVMDKRGFYASDLAIGDTELADKLFEVEVSTARYSRRKYRGHLIP
ncbi:MAG: hypothetical protein AAFV74_19755 [Pseudomonadota bacterium]